MAKFTSTFLLVELFKLYNRIHYNIASIQGVFGYWDVTTLVQLSCWSGLFEEVLPSSSPLPRWRCTWAAQLQMRTRSHARRGCSRAATPRYLYWICARGVGEDGGAEKIQQRPITKHKPSSARIHTRVCLRCQSLAKRPSQRTKHELSGLWDLIRSFF